MPLSTVNEPHFRVIAATKNLDGRNFPPLFFICYVLVLPLLPRTAIKVVTSSVLFTQTLGFIPRTRNTPPGRCTSATAKPWWRGRATWSTSTSARRRRRSRPRPGSSPSRPRRTSSTWRCPPREDCESIAHREGSHGDSLHSTRLETSGTGVISRTLRVRRTQNLRDMKRWADSHEITIIC